MKHLADALCRAGCQVDIFAADCIGRGERSIGEIFAPPTKWRTATGLWLGGLSWSPRLKRMLAKELNSFDVIHNHSVWMLPNSYASRTGLDQNRPVVITAHGTLEPWALSHSGWKKQLAGRWFQFRDLKTATCLHVNSDAERLGLRKLGLTNPIAILPNGVNLDEWTSLPDSCVFTDQYPQLVGKRILLFMARIHRKKGLDHLIEGWKNVKTDVTGWHLVIAGPDDGHLAASQAKVNDLGLQEAVTFVGALHGEQKKAALAAASAFVQPSFSEGFSMSIVEAMACGLPVLITPGCNFPEAVRAGSAIEVQPTTESTTEGLEAIIEMSDADLRSMGLRGHNLVVQDYTWDKIASKTLALYEWMKTASKQPEFVTYA